MKSKVHPTYKTKYRVANWPAYNRAVVRRGDVRRWWVLAPFAVGDVTYPLARKGAYATVQVAGAISGRNLLHRNVLTSQHQQRTAQAPPRAHRCRGGRDTHDGHENSPILVFFSNLLGRTDEPSRDRRHRRLCLDLSAKNRGVWTTRCGSTESSRDRALDRRMTPAVMSQRPLPCWWRN